MECQKRVNNSRTRFLIRFMEVLLLVLCLAGCSSGEKRYDQSDASMPENSYSGSGMEEPAGESAVSAPELPSETADTQSVLPEGRKLITTIDMHVETMEFDSMLKDLDTRVSGLGGYVENQSTYFGSSYRDSYRTRNADMTIRIPKDHLDEFLGLLSGMSNVVSQNKRVEDVTLTYVDLESHKKSLETEQTRLLQILEEAESLDTILAIENRLSEVRYQLERMASQLRVYDNQVDYSTIHLNIDEVLELTPVENESVWERISGGFADSLKNIGHIAESFAVWILANSPYLVILALILGSVLLKMMKERKKGKDTGSQEKKEG